MIVEEIRKLRDMMDEFYQQSPRSKTESDIYLEIDEEINKIQGMVMSAIVKGEMSNEHV